MLSTSLAVLAPLFVAQLPPVPHLPVPARNHAPTAHDDSATTIIGEPVPIFLLANDVDDDGDRLRVLGVTQPAHGTVVLSMNVATFTPAPGFSGTTSFTYTLSDGHTPVPVVSGPTAAVVSVNVVPPPPDPATVAPPPDNGVTTILAHATEFLYTGANAIQFDVAPGTIEPVRAAIMRGNVTTRGQGALSGVRITILDSPQYGSTFSRADGEFDLAVNGGGLLTVKYEKDGFCPVERQVSVPLQDFVGVPDVAMVAMDPAVTPVAFGSGSPMQVHQGTVQSDVEGARQATLVFPQGTVASLVQPDGTVHTMNSLHVRATEFTVGPDGPAAMPGVLPPTSGYTYCVELSVDEAAAAGAATASVHFSTPVFSYTQNYLGFPVGMVVPVGFYDSERAAWVPSQNGRVIGIVSISGGMANVDTDGDSVADNTGINDAERQQLASLYAAGQTLWRVPIQHFTALDYNWPFGQPADAVPPGDNGADAVPDDDSQPDSCQCPAASTIETDNQVLIESLPIVGTPYSLNYLSDRIPGRAKVLRLALGGPTMAASLQSIKVHFTIAGQSFDQTYPPIPDQHVTFVWNGLDAYGRPVQGGQLAVGSIDYLYSGAPRDPDPGVASFGNFGGALLTSGVATATVDSSLIFAAELGEGYADARTVGLGGWTLSSHHFYDPIGRVLHTGDGHRRKAAAMAHVITTVAGSGQGFGGDGGPATQALLFRPTSVAVDAIGNIYIVDSNNRVVRRVDPEGIITTVAGNGGFDPTGGGNGGLATEASLGNPWAVAVGSDGSFYFSDLYTDLIRRVAPDGILSTVAGRVGGPFFSGDGGPATQATLNAPFGVDVAPDGSLYISDTNNFRIRRVSPDGIINTVAGIGAGPFGGDGGPATAAGVGQVLDVAVGPDGSFYLVTDSYHRILRVGPDGVIHTVAGTGVAGSGVDGIPATQSTIDRVGGLDVAPDGSFYFGDWTHNGPQRVRRVSPDGIITTVAGSSVANSFGGDTGPANRAYLNHPSVVDVAPDGALYIADELNNRIRRVQQPLPNFTAADIVIASEDAAQLYLFDASGRHLATRNTLTGAILREFTYDDAGRLTSIVEKTGGIDNVTQVVHDLAGNPVAIIGPFGQQTPLTTDANGFLSSITNPASEQTVLSSSAEGLLTSLTDPRGKTSTYTYDAAGRLILDRDAVDGTQALARVVNVDTTTITRTTHLGRITTYETENLSGNVERRTVTAPDGTQSGRVESKDTGITNGTYASGVASYQELSADPRFGMESPITANTTLQFPSALNSTIERSRSAILSNPTDPLSLTRLTDTSTLAGHTTTSVYTAATRNYLITTPTGRTKTIALDILGRVVQEQTAGLNPLNASYDDRGRLATISSGSGPGMRTWSLAYNAQGFLDTLTDPIGRTSHFAYDAAGRITVQTLPDGQLVTLDYDAAGNVIGVSPPGHPAHTFAYSDRNELSLVTPPPEPGTGSTAYSYDSDRALTAVTRPGGQTITLGYNTAGKPITRVLATGGVTTAVDTFTYNAAGQVATNAAASGVNIGYTYDGSLRTGETWSGLLTGSVTKTFDNSLRVASQSVNGANTIVFSYDNDSLLIGAGDLVITRDPLHGRPTGTTLGVTSSSQSYNGFGEVMDFACRASGSPLYGFTFTRDDLGRISHKVETVLGVADRYVYTYDIAGNLTTVSKNGAAVESYSYDANHNRTNATLGGISVTATYDTQDRLMQYGGTTCAYTAAGDLLSKTAGGQTTTYEYNALGDLLGVTLPSATAVTYVVDALGRRVGRRFNGTLVQSLLYGDTLGPVAELNGSGALISRFVYADKDVPMFVIMGGIQYRIITDQLGSVRLVVNSATGAIVQQLDYDSFGNVLLDTNRGFQPFGFAGGLYDPDTKLVHFGARDYDAETGRWTAKDPIGFAGQDTNQYAFVANDPENRRDPSGLCLEDPWGWQGWKRRIAARFLKAMMDRPAPPEKPPKTPPTETCPVDEPEPPPTDDPEEDPNGSEMCEGLPAPPPPRLPRPSPCDGQPEACWGSGSPVPLPLPLPLGPLPVVPPLPAVPGFGFPIPAW